MDCVSPFALCAPVNSITGLPSRQGFCDYQYKITIYKRSQIILD